MKLSFALAATAACVVAMNNGRARTPPMGWRSWNQIGGATTQAIMEAQIAAISARNYTVNGVPTSLADLGYTDVGLDDYWQLCGSYGPDKNTYHNELGTPVVDESANKYPDMLAMTSKGHAAGLTIGWYGNNCGCSDHCTDQKCYEGDVAAAFEFGYDSIKLDGCGKEYDLDLWANLLNATGKAFMIENCHWGDTVPNATWCPWHYFRASGDIRASYGSVMGNLQTVVQWATQNLSTPGCWAFPDALEVGVYNGPGGKSGDPGLTYNEARSHFSAWCVSSSPLILGLDLTNATAVTSSWPIITNTEAIAVNQAWYGQSGNVFTTAAETVEVPVPQSATPSRSAQYGKPDPLSATLPAWQQWAKPLNASAVAVAVLNHDTATHTVIVDFASVPGLGYVSGSQVAVRDLYAHAPLGLFTTSWSATLDSHDSAFVVLSH